MSEKHIYDCSECGAHIESDMANPKGHFGECPTLLKETIAAKDARIKELEADLEEAYRCGGAALTQVANLEVENAALRKRVDEAREEEEK